ncbi:hypothetical protein ACOMHN_058500 [Nucella lapillus]
MQHLLTSSQIQFLILVVLAGPLLASSPDPPQRDTSFTRLALNDVLFTEDVLMEVSARSRIECSQKCMETEGCEMCTFHSSPQGPPGHCRLHSQLKTASDGGQPTTEAKTLARKRHCAGGYVLQCGRCLMAVDKTVKYTTARYDCISKQGRLVTTKTAAEVHCVWSFMKDRGFTKAWVGGDDMEKKGVFRWNDETLLPDDSPLWASYNKEPDKDSPGKDCVNLRQAESALFDSACKDYQEGYICQKDFL